MVNDHSIADDDVVVQGSQTHLEVRATLQDITHLGAALILEMTKCSN